MRKELYVNREKLITTKDAEGSLKFFRVLPGGEEIEIATNEEHLIDVLNIMLWPLDNLKNLFGQKKSPGPVYHLLSDMLETLILKMDMLCAMIEEECGGIKVYECNDVVPGIPKSTVLGVSREHA